MNKNQNQRFSFGTGQIFICSFEQLGSSEEIYCWEQSTIKSDYYIKYITRVDSIVLDPMMGPGTTGVSTLSLDRKFIGIEKDKKTYEIARERIGINIQMRKEK